MIAKTEALVLRVSPYSHTSHVVTWLTADRGKLATLVKGACRSKSGFLGQYDLAYTCELLFYERTRTGLHIARECTPLKLRQGLRSDWRACAAASYICDLLCRIGTPGDPSSALYALASATLDVLSGHAGGIKTLLWFELALLRTIGMAPRLTRCASCGSAVLPRDVRTFSAHAGGVLCPRCAPADGAAEPITADIVALMQHWERIFSPCQLSVIGCTTEQLFALQRHLGVFLMFHIDVASGSRQIANQIDAS